MLPSLKVLNETTILLQGNINFSTVVLLRKHGDVHIRNNQANKINFDFSEVNCCDSSGIALMIVWQKLANTLNKEIGFANVPTSLMQISTLCGVDTLLGKD